MEEDLAVASEGERADETGGEASGFRLRGEESEQAAVISLVFVISVTSSVFAASMAGGGGRFEIEIVGEAGGTNAGPAMEGVHGETGVVGEDEQAGGQTGIGHRLKGSVAGEVRSVFRWFGHRVQAWQGKHLNALRGGCLGEVAKLAGVGGGGVDLHGYKLSSEGAEIKMRVRLHRSSAGGHPFKQEIPMPKAVRFHELGGPEVLKIEEVAARQPGEGEALVKVAAVGLNRAESMYYHGHYLEPTKLPSGLGYEIAGTVTAVGPDVDKALVGKRFATIPGYSMGQYPSLAEEAVVPVSALAALPESLSMEEAAAAWMQYGTAYGPLVVFSKIKSGDFVIITAASSSVGLAAIQIVKAEGGVSIATTRTSAKKQELLEQGADYVIATEEEDLAARVKEITGGKLAQIVFDPVGGPYINVLGQATANGGTIYLYGMLSGEPTPFPMTTFARGITMQGSSIIETKAPEYLEEMKRYIVERLADGRFKPKIAKVFPFAQAVEAYQFLESNKQVGKIVITL